MNSSEFKGSDRRIIVWGRQISTHEEKKKEKKKGKEKKEKKKLLHGAELGINA